MRSWPFGARSIFVSVDMQNFPIHVICFRVTCLLLSFSVILHFSLFLSSSEQSSVIVPVATVSASLQFPFPIIMETMPHHWAANFQGLGYPHHCTEPCKVLSVMLT